MQPIYYDQNQSQYNIRSTNKLPPLHMSTMGPMGLGQKRLHTDNLSESDVDSTVGLRKVRKGYQLASYHKSIQYLHSQSYSRKFTTPEGTPDYQQFEVCVENEELKHYGLGIYLYLEFVKRLAITLLIMSAINFVPIVYAYFNGTGMSRYTPSYMIELAKTSLGNIQNGNQMAYMAFTVCDILSMIVFAAFYLNWRSFHAQAVDNEAKDINIVNPTNYALSVVGFDPATPNLQKNLTSYIDQVFGGAYQVQIVYNFNGNFSKFVHYDELVQSKQKQKQVMVQTGKNNQDFIKIQKQIAQIQDQLSNLSQIFEPQYAIIHFRTLKSLNAFVNFCRHYSLIDRFSYSLKRFICCTKLPPENQTFMRRTPLMIKSLSLSRPQQINWPNLDVSGLSRVLRWVISLLFLLISILITTSLIAICTLYVSSTSACTNYDSTTLVAKAKQQGGQLLYCYCAAHFTEIYTDPLIQSACQNLSNTILYANLMQVGASLVSSVSNVLLVIAVGLIAKYVLKPDSKPKQYTFIFVGVLVSNYINASVLPLVMNGDIFGFQSLQYLKFINFIQFDKVAIFKDFNLDWYAIVGPYYMNFLIIAIFSPIINLAVTCLFAGINNYKVSKACQNTDKQNPVIQKQANKMITSMAFDLPAQQALICLNVIIAVMYSSLLPFLLPITTIYLVVAFQCKKFIILRYSIRVPANQGLSQKIITIMPFVLLLHFLMGIWSHTAKGIFNPSSYLIQVGFNFLNGELGRITHDILMLGAGAIILAWIVFDFTILTFFSFLSQTCIKDDLDIPKRFASIENMPYQNYVKNANVLASYKLTNNPTYGHALKAYYELKKRRGKQAMKRTMQQNEEMQRIASNNNLELQRNESNNALENEKNLNLSPQKFGMHTMDTLNAKQNRENNELIDMKANEQVEQFAQNV